MASAAVGEEARREGVVVKARRVSLDVDA